MTVLRGIVPIMQPQASRLYLPQLDAMRFFAFLSVFLFHASPNNDISIHHGTAKTIAMIETTLHRSLENGVGLFFLLSAYLITELLRRETLVTGSIHLVSFYIRRALRIWPLYYLALTIGMLLSRSSASFHISRTELLSYLFFYKNWDVAFHGFTWNPIYILWTVSAEEQFYALWPLAQKWLKRRTLLAVCCVSIFAIACVAFWPTGYFFRTLSSQTVYLFVYFPLGALLAFSLKGRQYVARRTYCLSLSFGGLFLWIGGTYLSFRGYEVPGPFGLFLLGRATIVAGTVAIFLGFYLCDPAWWSRVPTYLGRISYGLYVFHLMGLLIGIEVCHHFGLLISRTSFGSLAAGLALKLTIGFVLTVMTAVVSYECYEKRFLLLKDRFAWVRSRPVQGALPLQ